MGTKLIWTGLAVTVALPKVFPLPAGEMVGAVLMVLGVVLLWLDK